MNTRFTPYLLVLPFVLIMCFIFLGGIFQAVVQSLGYLPAFGMTRLTLGYYRQVLADPRFLGSLRHTFYIAVVSSLISVIAGTGIAFAMNRILPGIRLSYMLYKTPIVLPHLVVVVLVFYIFSQTGIISRFMYALGVIRDPNSFPLFVYDKSGIGIMLVYLYKQIPFVSLTVFTVLKNLDRKYTRIAENLGAGAFTVLFRVTLPLLAPAVLSAFLITFAFDFGAFEVPFVLGSPSRLTLPVLAYFDHTNASLAARPAAMVMNVVISSISLILIWLYTLLFRLLSKHGIEGGAL
ncbi:MAG: ABC transporter permease subunit [Treponema sp.]|jgi:putative spermidine/putrescine transport system permease protein|nr:ABC transporter permease subunit [Treponema sp.]